MSTNRSHQKLNNSFTRKLKQETKRFVIKKNQQEVEKLMLEVGPILDNNFYLSSPNDSISLDSSTTLVPSKSTDEDLFGDNDSLSDLLSYKSVKKAPSDVLSELIEMSDNPSYVEDASFEVQRPKRIKLDDSCPPIDFRETVIEVHTYYEEVEVVVPLAMLHLRQALDEEIKQLRKKSKCLKNSLKLFHATTKYQILMELPLPSVTREKSATLLLSNVKFSQLDKKKKYFLIVTYGTEVLRSKVNKFRGTVINFDDDFVLKCSKSFEINVKLYGINHKSRWYSKGQNTANFELVKQYQVSFDDLCAPKPNFNLEIQSFNSDIQKTGQMWYYLEEEKAWKKYYCVLENEEFCIYKNNSKLNIVQVFDLKFVTYSRVENGTLIFSTCENNKLVKHIFKAVNVNAIKLWARDLNSVIDLLIDWNASFLSD